MIIKESNKRTYKYVGAQISKREYILNRKSFEYH